MDILSQALNVAEQADAATGSATLTFDLRKESHRAAYAAALAVLRIGGVDEDALIELAENSGPLPVVTGEAVSAAEEVIESPAASAYEQELRKRYLDAMTELTPDEATRSQAARETFPRVMDLLKDGANVEAVAQIQYRRWVEENLGSIRS